MLVDKKILTGGLVMIAIGIVLSVVLNDSVPIGEGGMTEEQKLEFLLEERENSDLYRH